MEWRERLAKESMKQTVHLYFHELAFAIKQNRVGLQGNYMEHLCQYFVNIQKYQSPIDPEFELPYNFVIKKYADASDLPPDPSESTLIFLPLNLDILRYIQNNKPELVPALQRLDVHSKIQLCFDYAQESAYPGNFCKTNSPLHLCTDIINFEQWNLFVFSTSVKNKPNNNNFKNVFNGISYTATWFFKVTQQETPWLNNPDIIYTHKGKSGPIRYFVPNNEFRPSRAHTIVAMHDKGMLDDTEWNMNSFKDWDMHSTNSPWAKSKWTERYFELFGTSSKTMSYPWNKTFNLQQPPKEYWPDDLLDNTYIYIATETYHDYSNEVGIPTMNVDLDNTYVNIEATEKIWKGFMYGIPMLATARQHAAQHGAGVLGFDVMEDMLSHPYDHIEDTDERVDAMLNSAINYPDASYELVERLHINKQHAIKKQTLWRMLDMTEEENMWEKLLDN